MDEPQASIRSYQRIFRPDRRLYQVEGRRLPVPGGVPLRWLGHATATLVGVVALSGRSTTVVILLAAAAGLGALSAAGGRAGLLAAASALVLLPLVGLLLAELDWPLRLLIVPALVATLLTQATPDGRPAHRFALSLAALWLAPARRSLDRTLAVAGEPVAFGWRVGVAPDEYGQKLRRGRVTGPAHVAFRDTVAVRRRRLRARSLVARPLSRRRRGAAAVDALELAAGERLEVRP